MLRRIAALLLVSALAAPLGADPDAPLDLTGARILASPGWPQALRAFLPPGRDVEPLALPLPAGPLLILGLVDRDPAAREVATATFGMKADEDLRGGYVVFAKRDGDRPLAAILAADAAALMAARFELETFVPAEKEKEPRSVEMQKPDEQAGVRTAPGRRQVQPRFRIRAAAGLGPGESVLDIAAAHANRFWVNDKTTDRELAQLRDHGVEPVVVTKLDATMPRELLLEWQKRGIRHFVADFRKEHPHAEVAEYRVGPAPNPAGPDETFAVQVLAETLRPGGLDELLVLPSSLDDLAVGRWGAPPDLRKFPEAQVGWVGPAEQPLAITRTQAEFRRKEAGVPVVLIEPWMGACAGEPLRIPSLPRGRAADLGEVLAGIVMLPGPASADALARAWAAPTDSEVSPELGDLMGACVMDAKDGPTFLIESAACLEQVLLGRYSDSPWMRGLPQRLREVAAALPPPEHTLLVRWTGDALSVDGQLVEPAWATTRSIEFGALPDAKRAAIVLRGLSDGRRVVLGFRIPDASGVNFMQLRFQTEEADAPLRLTLPLRTVGRDEAGDGQVKVAKTRDETGLDLEVAFEHHVLMGDAYPTRRIGFDLTAEGSRGKAWLPGEPAKDRPPAAALLVVR